MAGQDIEDGPARCEAYIEQRRDDGGALGEPVWRADGFMDRPEVGAQAQDAGCGGAGQQDGAHRLRANYEQGSLPRASAVRRVKARKNLSLRGSVGLRARHVR